MSSDLTFLTNEAGKTLRDRFGALLTDDTRFFDCLVGYFYISGFYKHYPALEKWKVLHESYVGKYHLYANKPLLKLLRS